MSGSGVGHALVLGAGGQDGIYLTRYLHDRGWRVSGIVRDEITAGALQPLSGVEYIACDLTRQDDLRRIIHDVAFDHVYNLAGFSSVADSWVKPDLCNEVNAIVARNVMALVHRKIKETGVDIRLFQASSAEIFGANAVGTQPEERQLQPLSPYGEAKLMAHVDVRSYRDAHGHHFVSGVLYNHESPIRPARFVTRRASLAAAAIAHGQGAPLILGNLEAVRDWGHASDYVHAMFLMMTAPVPDDYVIATGVGRSVLAMVHAFLSAAGIADPDQWIATDNRNCRRVDPPAQVGDSSRLQAALGWEPKISFECLVEEMVAHDVAAAGASSQRS